MENKTREETKTANEKTWSPLSDKGGKSWNISFFYLLAGILFILIIVCILMLAIMNKRINRISYEDNKTLAVKSYAKYLTEQDSKLKEVYLLNAFYHDPENTQYAKEYLESLNPVDDYSLIISFCTLLEEIIFRVNSDSAKEYYDMIIDYSAYKEKVEEDEEDSTVDPSMQFEKKWALFDESRKLDYYDELESCYYQIDSPSEDQTIRMSSLKDYIELCSIKKAVHEIKNALDSTDNYFDLLSSVSQHISSLLYASIGINSNDYFHQEMEAVKSEIIGIINLINETTESRALSEIKKAWEKTRKPLDYNNNKVTNDGIYNDMINFNALVANYSVYGSSNSFISEISHYSQMSSSRIQEVTERRYVSYQQWAAKIIARIDAFPSKERILDNYERESFFMIDKSLLSIQLSSWYDDLIGENLRKENPGRLGELFASQKKKLEEF